MIKSRKKITAKFLSHRSCKVIGVNYAKYINKKIGNLLRGSKKLRAENAFLSFLLFELKLDNYFLFYFLYYLYTNHGKLSNQFCEVPSLLGTPETCLFENLHGAKIIKTKPSIIYLIY